MKDVYHNMMSGEAGAVDALSLDHQMADQLTDNLPLMKDR